MKKLIISALVLFSFGASGQNKYLVVFNDKVNSTFSVERPLEFLSAVAIERRINQNIAITEQDFPVNSEYISALAAANIPVEYTSRWLNAALINIPKEKLASVLEMSFVKGLEGEYTDGLESSRARRRGRRNGTESIIENFQLPFDAGTAQNQLAMLGADVMHEKGFTGKGVLIALLDAGFSNANNLDVFKSAYDENRVIDTYDYVNGNTNVYHSSSHGTHVWSCAGANLDGKMIGTAPEASFILYLTENVRSETRMEEANWLFAAEKADSLGVDIIGSSLGYSTFDNPEQNYSYETLDGNTALITRAADWAASKGIIVVVSAGNSGSRPWRYVSPPADADSIISVAAVDANMNYASFSSVGPSVDGQIKPEIAAKGLGTTIASPTNEISSGNGTSYAAPLITGLMAGLKQAFPNFTAMELREILLNSGSQAQQPDNLLGYGIPNFERAFDSASLQQLLNSTEKDLLVFPNPKPANKKLKVLVTKEESGSEFSVSLTASNGSIVYEEHFKQSFFNLDILNGKLATGVYILKVWNDGFTATERILIE